MTPPDGHDARRTDALDEVYEALGHPIRRRVLLALQEQNPLAVEALGAIQPGLEPPGGAAEIDLHHVHLPLLAEAGFVDWAPGDDAVTRGPRFEELRPHLELLRERE